MASGTLFTLSVTFALVTGTAAGVLALLTWELFRTSPFGRALFMLTVVMAWFTLYHAALLAFGQEVVPVARLIQSAVFTGMALFIGMVIWSQRRFQKGVSL